MPRRRAASTVGRRRVAAHGDDGVAPQAPQHLAGLRATPASRRRRNPARDAAPRHGTMSTSSKRVPRRRDQPLLEPARRADERDGRVGRQAPDRVSRGQPRVDVAAGAAGGNDDARSSNRFRTGGLLRPTCWCRRHRHRVDAGDSQRGRRPHRAPADRADDPHRADRSGPRRREPPSSPSGISTTPGTCFSAYSSSLRTSSTNAP